jgi:RimJ/RimL family protein N-acetyltransferase
MIPPLRPGAAAAHIDIPTLETEHLKLRPWTLADVAPYMAMLSDPGTARFITLDGKPVTNEFAAWGNVAVMAGHWALYGTGMWVIEEKSSGKFAGRAGPWLRSFWPGVEVGVAIPIELRRRGYGLEAMRASVNWTFANFDIDEIIHCCDRENTPMRALLRQLGAQIERPMTLLGRPADLWTMPRSRWFEGKRADAA